MPSRLSSLAAVAGAEPAAAPSRIKQDRGKALERGFAQDSMRELALHSGITTGSLYQHFVSKEQLLFELIEEFYDDLHEMFVLSETGTPMQRLQALVQARGLHFLMAGLAPTHQQQILLLRGSYTDKFLQRLQAAGATASTATLKACVQGLVVWRTACRAVACTVRYRPSRGGR
jgi:AcrR family transcriptional regulator